MKGAGKQVEKTIRVIKETGADKEKTKAARMELQGFMDAIAQKKSRDAYIEKKLEKLERRKGKQSARNESGVRKSEPLKVGEKVRVTESGVVGEVSKVSNKSVTLIIGSISSTMSPDKVERISSNEFREAVRKDFKPAYEQRDVAVTARRSFI